MTPPTEAPDAVSADVVEHLEHVIDRDRYVVAACLGRIKTAIRGRTWLLEGRGPYEWDDDRYRDEFAAALNEIEQAAEPLAIVGWDKSDCTRIEERVHAASLAARDMLAQPHGPREMIWADVFGDPRDGEIEQLKAEIQSLSSALTKAEDDIYQLRVINNRFRNDYLDASDRAIAAESQLSKKRDRIRALEEGLRRIGFEPEVSCLAGNPDNWPRFIARTLLQDAGK